jgi:hypothetical protein
MSGKGSKVAAVPNAALRANSRRDNAFSVLDIFLTSYFNAYPINWRCENARD